MILSAQSIRARCLRWTPPLLAPFVERGVSPAGRSFGLFAASYDVRIDQDIVPRGFMLASTLERFNSTCATPETTRPISGGAAIKALQRRCRHSAGTFSR